MLALRAAEAAEEERLFKLEHPNQVLSSTPFEEKEFGYPVSLAEPLEALGVTNDIMEKLSAIVVSLALFDGDSPALCLCILHIFMCSLLVSDLTHDLVQGIRCYLHAQA